MNRRAVNPGPIRLLVADVDGTLLASDRTLRPRTKQAVQILRSCGIAFAAISSRPPRGMSFLVGALEIATPLAGFNGGMFTEPDLSVLDRHTIQSQAAGRIVSAIQERGVEVWVYAGSEWYVLDSHRAHVAKEVGAVGFPPTVVPGFGGVLDGVVKIVAVSDDAEALGALEAEIGESCVGGVSASRSQSYYLDITSPRANKGEALTWLSTRLGIPTEHTATIGDMPADVLMFRRSGLSIAMGNAAPEVKTAADAVTSTNDEEGFARAVEDYVLPAAGERLRGTR